MKPIRKRLSCGLVRKRLSRTIRTTSSRTITASLFQDDDLCQKGVGVGAADAARSGAPSASSGVGLGGSDNGVITPSTATLRREYTELVNGEACRPVNPNATAAQGFQAQRRLFKSAVTLVFTFTCVRPRPSPNTPFTSKHEQKPGFLT